MSHEGEKPHVVIFSRPGCHLCDEARNNIAAAGMQNEYTLAEVNIEDDPELLRLYRYDIPVITINGREAFRHRVAAADFKQALARHT